VGYPRVTHPFAAFRVPKDLSSLDLHVLGAPPAFVLSQDQTLREKLSAPPGGGLLSDQELPIPKADALEMRDVAPQARKLAKFSNALRC
jgi:hypothetical protein